jgi:diguanylate cyclase
MQTSIDEHERTLAFAEIALGQIRALKLPATPRNFEVWYHYATGYMAALNKLINERLSRGEKLGEAEINEIYDNYLSPMRLTERLGNVNLQVMGEVEQVMTVINRAVGSSSTYSESLAGASQELVRVQGSEGVRSIVETLLHDTRTMRETNEALEARLNASRREISLLQENLEAVRTESLTDPLTSLANRKYFDSALARSIKQATASGESLSLMMIDIDHFKNFNDSYGHVTGDQVLRLVAMAVNQNVKGQDLAARYGGEEFAVVLPQTVLRSAITVADHIRRAVMTKELMKRSTGEHLGRIAVSVGVASLRPGDTMATLLERADACLYTAKRTGRNRVISETDPEMTRGQRQQVA